MDFGLLTALQGRRDWQQVRADRMLSLQLLQKQEENQKQQVSEQNQAFAGLQAYYDSLKEISVLDVEQQKVQQKAKELEKPIIEGLSKYNGDVRKFMLSGGFTLLQNHKNELLASEELQNAKANTLNYSQAMIDRYMGRKPRPVTYKDKQGNDITTNYDTALAAYQNGEIDTLPYAGSVQPLDPIKVFSAIQQTYGKDPYKRPQATKQDIINYAKSFGAEDWEANQMAAAYEQNVAGGGTPVYFNYKERPQQASTGISDKTWSRIMKAMQGDKNMFKSYMNGNLFMDMGKGAPENVKWDGNDVALLNQKMLGETKDKIMNLTELRYDKENDVYYYLGGKGVEPKSGKEIDLTDIDIKPSDISGYTVAVDKNGNKQGYIRTKIKLGNREAKEKDLIGIGGSWDNDKLERETTFNVKGDKLFSWAFGANYLEGEVLIPTTYNSFTDAENRYPANEEDRFGENNMLENVQTDQVIQILTGE